MRIFVTSGTGVVGSAVADAFVGAGHKVTALTRSRVNADRLIARGITPLSGDLERPGTFSKAAATHDVIVHTAFAYDASGKEITSIDIEAVRSLINAATEAETSPRLIYTSSAFLLGGIAGEVLDEFTPTEAARTDARWRLALEDEVVRAAGIKGTVIRLGVVYGGSSFTLGELFSSCERHQFVSYSGDPEHRWPFIYLGDAAALYLAVAQSAGGGIFHAVDGSPLPLQRVAELASGAAGCGGAVRRLEPAADDPHALRISYDTPVVATRSRGLGWAPTISSLVIGIDRAWSEWRTERHS